jgi:hypothetical protein
VIITPTSGHGPHSDNSGVYEWYDDYKRLMGDLEGTATGLFIGTLLKFTWNG